MEAPNRPFLKYVLPFCLSCSACFAAVTVGDIFLFSPLPIRSLSPPLSLSLQMKMIETEK